MPSIYCTVLSKPFVARALALQQSLVRMAPDVLFGFYCIDDATAPFLRSLNPKNSLIFSPDDFETPALRSIKYVVTPTEYCWTCKSVALLHALGTVAGLDWAVWVDSDMFAFGNPDKALESCHGADVLLTPHRFSTPAFKAFEPSVGRFNAGYAAFRNNEGGRAALNWWRDRCFEDCSAAPMGKKYGDQKYLEDMAALFDRVAVADGAGLNCAPWNVLGLPIEDGVSGVKVAQTPLLLYHFQGLKVVRRWLFDLYGSASVALPQNIRRLIYMPYIAALVEQVDAVATLGNGDFIGIDAEFSAGAVFTPGSSV